MNYLSSISRGFQKGILFSDVPREGIIKDHPYVASFFQGIQSSQMIYAIESVGFVPSLNRYVLYITPYVLGFLRERNFVSGRAKEIMVLFQKHQATLTKVVTVAIAITLVVIDQDLGETVFLAALFLKYLQFNRCLSWGSGFAARFQMIKTAALIPISFLTENYFLTAYSVDNLCQYFFPAIDATIVENIEKVAKEVDTLIPAKAITYRRNNTYLEKRFLPPLFHGTASCHVEEGDKKYQDIQWHSQRIVNALFHQIVFGFPAYIDEEMDRLKDLEKEGTKWEHKFKEVEKIIKKQLADYEALSCVKNLKNPTLVKIKLLFLAILQSYRVETCEKNKGLFLMPRQLGLPNPSISISFAFDKYADFTGNLIRDSFTSSYIVKCIILAIVSGRITYQHLYEWKKSYWKGDPEVLRATVEKDYEKVLKWGNENFKNLINIHDLSIDILVSIEMEEILGPLLVEMGIIN